MRLSFQTDRQTRTDYVVTSDLLAEEAVAEWRNRHSAIIYDACLEKHHPTLLAEFLDRVSPRGSLAVEGGESFKNINQVIRLLSFLSDNGLAKNGILIAVGGGSVCDVVSLTAQLFRRGVGLALIPTTLLGQIDAAVGGKNGINFAATKNLVGHFYHPEAVICDITFLGTLAQREMVGGLAEAIKVLAVSDASRFHRSFAGRDWLRDGFSGVDLATLVADAVEMKLALLAEDPFELSSRRLLNYGHAFAHNFEEESQFALSHGEAVLIGMTIENAIAMELGMAGREIHELQAIIAKLFTPACRRHWIDRRALPPLLDKLRLARRSCLNLVCLRSLGEADILDDVSTGVMFTAWDRAGQLLMGSRAERPDNALISDTL